MPPKSDLVLPAPDQVVDRETVLTVFRGKCVRCRLPATEVHEITPRSLSTPERVFEFQNRVPLCHACHTWAHNRGTEYSTPVLTEFRQKRLEDYYGR